MAESLDRSRDTIAEISEAQDHPSQLFQDSSNNVVHVQKIAHVTPTRHERFDVADYKDGGNGAFTTPFPGPSCSSEVKATFDIGKVFSPLTPPSSPSLHLSDNETSGLSEYIDGYVDFLPVLCPYLGGDIGRIRTSVLLDSSVM